MHHAPLSAFAAPTPRSLRSCFLGIALILASPFLGDHALHADELIAPDSVTAEDDGSFLVEATFTVDPGPTLIDSVDLTGVNVSLNTVVVVGNCAFALGPGGVLGAGGAGALIDDSQIGTVTVTVNTCNGPTFTRDILVLPAGGVVTLLRGDADSDGSVIGLLDALFILSFGFGGGPSPQCLEAADTDSNGQLTALLDALYLLNFFFTGGPSISAPYPNCGLDPDAVSSLGCMTSLCP